MQFSLRGHLAHYGKDIDYLELCAVRELSIAQHLEAGRRHGQRAIPSDGELAGIGMTAMMKRDLDTLQMVTSKMPEQKADRYLGGYYTALTGVATSQPKLVSAGLQEVLDSLHRMRDKDWRICVIKLQAQGLYRLCEWFDPALVAEFDVQQAYPWDAGFHQWCEGHADPLEELDLSTVSKVLHDIVILRQPPSWLPEPPPLYELVLIGGDAKSKALAELVGGFAGAKTKDAREQLMKSCPISLCWNLDRRVAERDCKYINECGGIAEARIMPPTPARFLELKG